MEQARKLWAQGLNWWHGAGRNARVAAGVGAVIIFCCACSLGIGLLNGASGAGSSAAANATTGGSSARATTTHAAKPTPAPSGGVTTATLGGPETAFVAEYGAPTLSASESRIHKATIQGQDVAIAATLNSASDNGRIRYLSIQPANPSTIWSNNQAENIAKNFLPPDAVFIKNLDVADFGIESVYKSTLLAQSFPSSAFQDANGNKVTPGAFYLACGDQVDGAGKCSLQLGE